MAQRTVSHLYATYDEAVQAIYDLEQAGIPSGDISMVGSESDPRLPDNVYRDSAESPAGAGAAIGATAVGGVGVLAGLGALAIPGLGPLVAAGWLIAGLTGAGIGAAAGGLVGALTHLGVTNENAHLAAEGIQNGGTLVVVRAAYDQVELVQNLLRRDHRSEARHVAAASPIIETAAEETATVPAAGDYGDELARIERERERIERGG